MQTFVQTTVMYAVTKHDCNSTFSHFPTKQCPYSQKKKNPPNLKFPNLKTTPGS